MALGSPHCGGSGVGVRFSRKWAYLRSMVCWISESELPFSIISFATRATSRQIVQVKPMPSISTVPSGCTSSMKQS